jgi:hypothetical protein
MLKKNNSHVIQENKKPAIIAIRYANKASSMLLKELGVLK